MTLHTRVLFALAACAALSAVAYLSFRGGAAEPISLAVSGTPALVASPESSPPPTPAAAPPPPEQEPPAIPYRELTRTAAARNEVIYTTSAMGEPMEVHPDGTVVIHNHRKVFTYADGRQEVRFARITAKPAWVPASGLAVPSEDPAPPK